MQIFIHYYRGRAMVSDVILTQLIDTLPYHGRRRLSMGGGISS